MILNEKTKQEFGYYPDDLSNGSHKKIWIRCDYCQSEITKAKKSWAISNNIIDKDACGKCKTKKGKEVLLKQYGVENNFQLESVKKKIVETNREKYGCDYHVQTQEFKEKSKQTMLDKYGVEHCMQNKEIKAKANNTIKEKYGVDNVSQCEEIRDKVKQTNLDKYGNENYLLTNDYKEKTVKTNIEKYGVENVFASEEIKEKIRETNLEKYGVEYPQQNQDIREKTKHSNFEKYGHEYPQSTEPIKEKIKKTNLEKYGCEYATQSDSVKYKIVQTNLKKYGCKCTMQYKPFKDKAYQSAINSGHIKIYNGKNRIELSKETGIDYNTLRARIAKYGIDQALKMTKKCNSLEACIENILKDNNIIYEKHTIINKRKTDFVIPQIKLVIEVDGIYWHSDKMLEDNYHQIKKQDYINAGYQSLFFREDEVINKIDVVKSIIFERLGLNKTIKVTDCIVKNISKPSGAKFLDHNGLIGRGLGTCYGLFHNNELVACMRIYRNIDKEYEISRYVVKNGVSVLGGFSKLLNFVEKSIDMDILNATVDLRFQEDGAVLVSNGFTHTFSCTTFRWTDNQNTFHRMKYPGNSGYDLGLAKIWDCGQAKYVKNYKI